MTEGAEKRPSPDALLAEASKEVEFTFYPNSTSQSGRYGDEIDEREVLRSIIANVKPAPGSAGEQTDHYLDALVESRVNGEKIVCRLRTLSEIILGALENERKHRKRGKKNAEATGNPDGNPQSPLT